MNPKMMKSTGDILEQTMKGVPGRISVFIDTFEGANFINTLYTLKVKGVL